jgi:hypothetical protein
MKMKQIFHEVGEAKLNKETICYAIKLTDGGYVSFFQHYEDGEIHVISNKDISEADFWSEDEVHKEFEELMSRESENIIFGVGIRPLKIVRATIKVEDEWE